MVEKGVALDRITATVDAARLRNRISLTDVARTSLWKERLKEHGVVEVTDRSDPYAYIVSAEGMAELVGRLEELEDEIERYETARMVRERDHKGKVWLSDGELADSAMRLIDERMGR